VVFVSFSQNLVPGDIGWVDQDEVYLHDRVRHTTERVSPERSGPQSTDSQMTRLRNPVVSSGGRFVAFDTAARDLPADDGDGEKDVFVWDSVDGSTELVSTPPAGGLGQSTSTHPAISNDGRIVAYTAATSEEAAQEPDRAIYVHDRQERTTELVAEPGGSDPGHEVSSPPVLSPDGRYVVFRTSTGTGTDQASSSVVLHDRSTDQTEVVTELGGAAVPGNPPAVSGDGRFVAFASSSDELVPGDTNGDVDIFVRDRRTGSTEVVSVGRDGKPKEGRSVSPSISADGRHVVFHSKARLTPADTDRFDDVYVYDRDTDEVTLASEDLGVDPRVDDPGHRGSYDASIDDAGRHIAFSTPDRLASGRDTNLDTDVYVRDYLGGPRSTEPPPFPGVPCPDLTSASVTCSTDSRGRLVLRGTDFNEWLYGTREADVIRGGRGSDTVMAFAGPDRLYGGAGRDFLRAGAGRDVVECGSGLDRVWGARADKVHPDCERVRRN
jgi:Tol biopolymer transport system component